MSLLQGRPHHQTPGLLIPPVWNDGNIQAWLLQPQVPQPCPGPSFKSYPITSTAWPCLAPSLCLTSRHLPLSSHQPALSFTQSHLFRNSSQHSALYPQISPQQLTQCLGVFAAATVAGSPGQLNKVAWHQLAGVAYDGRFAIRALKTFAVSYVCMSRVMYTHPLSIRHRHKCTGNTTRAPPHLLHAHRWLQELLLVTPTPETWLRPCCGGHRLVTDKIASAKNQFAGILSNPHAMLGSSPTMLFTHLQGQGLTPLSTSP